MAYATWADLVNRYHFVTTANLTSEEFTPSIEAAGGIIDGYCARNYAVPFTAPISPLIKWLCVDLAMVDVVDRCPTTPEFVKNRIERAYKMLELLADGTILLPDATEGADAGRIRTSTAGYVPTFGVNPSHGEQVDPQRAEDEANARGIPWERW